MHDKLVLDITRQGGFPAVFSLVSSGIKKVSSSPPKEGGISFFKASSLPKDGAGFKSVNPEKRLFQGFFLPDKGVHYFCRSLLLLLFNQLMLLFFKFILPF